MNQIKILGFIMTLAMALPAIADVYKVTPQEHAKMLNEADDWIDDMPDGLQDKLSDAVMHSLRGFNNEIIYFRQQGVEDSIIYPEVSSRWILMKDSNVKIRLYKNSENTAKTLLVYFHGGGWTLGSVKSIDKYCRALASDSNIEIAAIEYPQAPENDYVEIISKCASAIRYLYQLFGSEKQIAIGGDGAGGNLALSSYYLLQQSDPKINISSLVLYYPLLSVKTVATTDEGKSYSRGFGLDGRVLEAFSRAYNAGIDNEDNYITSVSQIPDNKIKELPPVLIIMGGRDIIIGEERAFYKRAERLGVNVHPIEFDGSIHGFITDNHQPTAFSKTIEITRVFLSSLQDK